MEQSNDAPKEVKVCLLGDQGVGKTNIILRFVSGTFENASKTTIGCAVTPKSIDIDGETIIFQIWDTVGQEKFKSIVPQFYRGAAAVIVVYDITSSDSFKFIKRWVEELTRFEQNAKLAVAGNKCDLEDDREVSREEGRQYAEQINAIFKETSAKRNVNIEELIMEIGQALPEECRIRPNADLLNIGSRQTEPKKQRPRCCK